MSDGELHCSYIYRNISKQPKVSLALMLEGNWVNVQQTVESEPFVFAGRTSHRLRRCHVNGPVWSGLR